MRNDSLNHLDRRAAADAGRGAAAARLFEQDAAGDAGGMATTSPLGDAELVARAQADPEAFAAIYRLHYSTIGRYLYRRVGDRTAAEDLVAETFLIALREIRRFQWRGVPVLHWLFRIATHAANRWARRRRFLDLAHIPEGIAGEAPDRMFLHKALRRLPSRFQEVLALHYLAELPVVDVARLLGVPPGTVKSRLSRARDALRRRLDQEQSR
jgi:RNA polymerase sigma-70 factor (ECF subfamily)